MSSQAETAKIDAELKLLRSALGTLADTRIRDVIENRIKECRARLRRLQKLLREKSKIQNKRMLFISPTNCTGDVARLPPSKNGQRMTGDWKGLPRSERSLPGFGHPNSASLVRSAYSVTNSQHSLTLTSQPWS
jgi:hypothetical protein